MNILFLPIHYYLSDKFGSEPSWGVEVMNRLARRGHQIFAVAGRAELQNKLHPNIQLFVMDKTPRPKNALVELFNKLRFHWFYYKSAKKILKSQKIDVIHHFAPISPNSFNLFFLLAKKNAAWVMGPAMPPAQSFSKKEFGQWLGSDDNFWTRLGEMMTKLSAPALSSLTRRSFARIDKIICVTNEAKGFYQKFVEQSKIKVIPVGIDTQIFSGLQRRRNNKTLNLLAVAYLTKRKGINLLIEAFAKIQLQNLSLCLTIVGDGPEKESLIKITDSFRVQEKVKFAGFIPHNQIAKFYTQADIFVSPTLYEPYGQTILEAMAAGLPVVASKVGGIPSMVDDSVGILVKPGNIEELADALAALINSSDLRKKKAQVAQEKVKKIFEWEKIINQYLNVYGGLLTK